MFAGIMSSLIATALIEGGKKFGTMVFREKDVRDWVESSDFREFLDEKIRFETPPEPAPDPAALTEFFSSDTVLLIVEQVFEQNDQSLSKLEEEFVRAAEGCIPDSEVPNPEFAHWLFNVLISAFETFLSTKAKKGDTRAEEYLHVVRHKKEVKGQKEIVEKVDGVQKSVTELQRSIERPAGGRIQKFIRWQEYFRRVEQHLMPLDTGPRLKQTAYYLNKAEEFLADNHNKILVLHAPGGSGKSHLLRQIAFDLEVKHPEYTILSVTPDFPSLEDALSSELDGDGRYLLLFDDADRRHKELAPLFTYVKYHSSNVKAILTARTAGLRGIYQTVLKEQLCQGLAEVARIRDWDRDDLKELLRFVLDGRHHRQEELIVARIPNPYLIIWTGKIMKGEPGVEVEKLQQKFVADIESAAFQSLLPEFDEETAKAFLADLALIGSFRKDDKTILSLLEERYGIGVDQIRAHIDLLTGNGVLREVGFSTRFNPDMTGDLYLAYCIDQIQESGVLSRWIDSWGPAYYSTILENLEAASRIYKGDIIKEYYSAWVNRAIEESKATSGYARGDRLESLSRFCHLVPEESIDLMYTYIDIPPPEGEDGAILSPNKDTYGAVILPLIRAGQHREEIFDLLDHIHQKVPDGRYFNYEVGSLVAETVSPFYNTLEKIRETLTLLEDRLDVENEFSIIALGKALSEALRADHEMSYLSSPITITWGARPLPATPAVLETREHAISILKRMLCHQSVQVRRKAVEISGKIGSKSRNGECPLSERIAEERRIILAEFEQLVPHESYYGVLCDIESLLFWWWEYKVPGTEDAESILEAFLRPMEYILYGLLFYSRPLFLSFNPETIPLGEKERDDWCFNVNPGLAIYTDTFTGFCETIVNYLSTKYSNPDSVTTLLQELQGYLAHANLNIHQLESLLSAWIAKDPEIFFELRNREQFWSELPIGFKNAIDLGLCTRDPKELESFADEILIAPQKTDSRRIDRFIWLMTRYPPDEARVRDWLAKLIDTGQREIHLTLLHNLRALSSRLKNYEICVTSYLDILSYYETMDEKLLESVSWVLHDLTENEDRLEGHQKDAIKRCFKQKLISTPSLGNSREPHVQMFQRLINYILTDTEEILDFVRQRAGKKRDSRNYQVLPLDKVSFLENVGECTELDPILDELLALMNEGLIYREQLSVQLRPIMSLRHQASGKLCLEEYAERLLNEGRVGDALALCPAFLSQPGTEETVLKILGDAVAAGKRKDIGRLFREYIWYGGISIEGSRSPDLEQKREVISRLLNLAPGGQLRAVLREVLKRVYAEIQAIAKEYEEDCVIR